jgi:hypothetical protein
MSGDSCGKLRGGRIIADDDGPGANLPMLDEAVADVGIVLRESSGGIGGGAAEDEESAVGGFGEGSGEDEIAAEMGFAGEEKMLIARRSTASDEVVDYFIEEGEIGHGVCQTRNRVSRWGGGAGIGAVNGELSATSYQRSGRKKRLTQSSQRAQSSQRRG